MSIDSNLLLGFQWGFGCGILCMSLILGVVVLFFTRERKK